jgi:ParB/RepB/Spo0J family partition protein
MNIAAFPSPRLRSQPPNPRKRFDAKSLEELAASFKTQGILAPLLVRELEESKYEVVAGARRLRAAKLAELEKLPVRVVKLTDAQAIEAQRVENLQREDIHPLEEALGFKSLLELGEPVYTIATIASRAGKSAAYECGGVLMCAPLFLCGCLRHSHPGRMQPPNWPPNIKMRPSLRGRPDKQVRGTFLRKTS